MKSLDNIDISVNITCHKEGYLLYQTLRSISNSIDYLLKHNNVSVSVNLSLDNADDITTSVAERFNAFNCIFNIYKVSFGQPALCRNYLIDKSNSKYIVFFDGDDFFSENYLNEAYVLAESKNEPCVLSVAMILEFDQNNALFIRPKIDINSKDVISYIMNDNPINSCFFAHSTIFKDNRYESVEPGSGFGYEDWHLNTKLFAKKIDFYIIPNTILFYRRCHDPARSILASHVSSKTVLRPSDLFLPSNFVKFNTYLGNYIIDDEVDENSLEHYNDSKKLRVIKKLPIPHTFRIYMHEQYAVFRKLFININKVIKRRFNMGISRNPMQKSFVDLQNAINNRLAKENITTIDSEVFLKQWVKANEFEPLIWPTVSQIENMPIYRYKSTSNRAKVYYDICKKVENWGSNYNIVFIPWLIMGGADLVTLETVNNFANKGENVLLVFTEKAKSEWKDKLHKNILTYNLKDNLPLKDEDYNDIFIKLILNTKPKRFVSINSLFANKLLRDYSKLLRKYTKLYTYRFSLPKDDRGMYYEWPANFYNSVIEDTIMVTDNNVSSRMYQLTFGRGNKNIKKIEMPIDNHPKPNNPKKVKNRVLWASRIAPDKLVLESIEIASKLRPGIETDFYGTLDGIYSKDDVFNSLINRYTNVHYKGTFNGFGSIDVSRYDLLLFVSRSEGTPLIVLESVGANLFVVASKVGGIPDIISQGINGTLIEDPLDIGAYVNAINDFYDKHDVRKAELQIEHNAKLMQQRTVKNLELCLDKIYS